MLGKWMSDHARLLPGTTGAFGTRFFHRPVAKMMNLSTEHIVSDPDMCFGKPRISGTRLTVKDVISHHRFQGMSAEEIADDWKVSLAAVYAAFAYYYDHKEEIDRSFIEDKQFIQSLRASNRSLLDALKHRSI